MWTGFLVTLLLLGGALGARQERSNGKLEQCSSYCGNEYAGFPGETKLCMRLCKLFDVVEPATLDDVEA